MPKELFVLSELKVKKGLLQFREIVNTLYVDLKGDHYVAGAIDVPGPITNLNLANEVGATEFVGPASPVPIPLESLPTPGYGLFRNMGGKSEIRIGRMQSEVFVPISVMRSGETAMFRLDALDMFAVSDVPSRLKYLVLCD